MISYRPMLASDVEAGLRLCRLAGWNQLADDWKIFLESSPDGCRVAIDDEGNVVGTVTTIRYENHFSWIGMVLVDPDNRRQGIGQRLLAEALQILPEDETAKLDATPEGREVYLKSDFVDEYRLSRMQLDAPGAINLPEANAVRIHQNDLSEILEIDREVFGASRQYLLNRQWERSPYLAFVVRRGQQLRGYCFGRKGHNYIHIGPVVAEERRDAINLVSAALQNCAGSKVILDASHFSNEWIPWLSSIGFVEQRTFIRMYRGTNHWPGRPEKQFAILGPEFG